VINILWLIRCSVPSLTPRYTISLKNAMATYVFKKLPAVTQPNCSFKSSEETHVWTHPQQVKSNSPFHILVTEQLGVSVML
jgi:hypothetical protein